MKLARLVVLGAVAALLWVAAPAAAAASANIDYVEVNADGRVRSLFAVSGLPPGVAPDPGTAVVRVDGQDVVEDAGPVAAGRIKRTTVLALDTSLSMSGDKFEEAKAAANAFLAAAPDDLKVGLVTFDSTARVVAQPTTDHGSLTDAISELELRFGTRLFDAIIEAIEATGDDGARSVVVLSDGIDKSDTPVQRAVDAASSSGVRVDAIALQQSAEARSLLAQITKAGGGAVIPADDAQALKTLFEAEGQALSGQILVEFDKPAIVEDEATLRISVMAGGRTYTDTAFVSLRPTEPASKTRAEPAAVVTPAPLVDKTGLLVGSAALAVGLAGILAIVLLGRRPDPQTVLQRQMAYYSLHHYSMGPSNSGATNQSAVATMRKSAVAVAETIASKGDIETTLARRLTGAGLSVTAAEWLLLHAGVAVLSALVGFLVGGTVALGLGLAIGVGMPWLYLSIKHTRRLSAFSAQLPETLTLIAGGLSAGLSLPQAIDTAVRETSDPIAAELRRSLVEQRLGIDIDDAIDGVADRMTSQDLRWVVIAIRIHREVGGNLAELLTSVAATLREREFLRRQVKVLTAEGRVSGWILSILPFAMVTYLILVRPDYLRPMYTEPLGLLLSCIGALLLGLGAWSMSRLVKVEA